MSVEVDVGEDPTDEFLVSDLASGHGDQPDRISTGRMILWFLVAVVLAGIAYVGITFVQVWNGSRSDEARAVDAIVVLGAAQYDGRPSPVLEARLVRAFELYDAGHAAVIVTTGSNQIGDRFTEGFAGYEYLRNLGVPEDQLLVVVDGNDTYEQLSATAVVLRDRGLSRVLLVSDPYHSYRAKAIAEEVGLVAYVSPTDIDGSFRQLVRETAAVSIGRIIGYRRVSGLR
jgi:uncharacterized SAM-binding protein YcdF (DUF218 family)